MKTLPVVILLFLSFVAARAADEVYVVAVANENVTFSDGTTYTMQSGEHYPFAGYDSSQTMVQLRLGTVTFWARKTNTQFVEKADTPAAMQENNRHIQNYLDYLKKTEQTQPKVQQPTFEELQQIVELYTKLQQLNNTQGQQSLNMIQQLQALKAGRSQARVKQTPAEANAWWQQYQQQQKLSQMQAEVERLRQQQRR